MARTRLGLAALVLLTFSACSRPPSSSPDSGTPDADTSADSGVPVASAECPSRCEEYAGACAAQLSVAACTRACPLPGTGAALEACLLQSTSCEDVRTCGTTYRAPPTVAFSSGPYGLNPRDVAGDFALHTVDGPWSFAEEWTGEDSYVFVVFYPESGYSRALFTPSGLAALLADSPPNVHYFFLRASPSTAFSDFVAAGVGAIEAMPAAEYLHWRNRVHFGDENVLQTGGWLGDLMRARQVLYNQYDRYGRYQFALDPAQRLREVGMLGTLQDSAQLQFLANEARAFNFEQEREARLAAENAHVVTALTDFVVSDWEGPNNWRDAVAYPTVEFPDEATMAGYDKLEVDLSLYCRNHRDADCGAWDYIATLYVCEGNPEPVGRDCTREGQRDADGGILVLPDGGLQTTCTRPARPGCDKEIARQITPYWREGRWVTDLSPMLPFVASGGAHTFRWVSKHQFHDGAGPGREVPYVLSLSFRLGSTGASARPVEIVPLWTVGGALDTEYASRNPPVSFAVPDGVTRAQLVALITGHGMDAPYNCAEFCDHRHHFSVNGKAPHTLSFPEVGQLFGCRDKVDEGVVANQAGTWYFGRGGWCPGQDVKPYVVDITADLTAGQNTIRYTATYGNNPPVAGTSYGGIDLESYLVFYR